MKESRMRSNPTPSLTGLDALIRSLGFPVRSETLDRAWTLTVETPTSRRFQERAHRTLEGREPAASGEVTILVTLRAKPGRGAELELAAVEFVEATRQLEGALGSTLYRSEGDPLTLTLVERFAGQEAFSRHMASAYFRRFQIVQQPLLAAPVEAVFLERLSEWSVG
jgi:quinol monooxygenase YgiN